jgi:XRE family aerobic/anaerobic benzoate catabolism transcriptional regulator
MNVDAVLLESLGERVRRARSALGLTAREAAERAGLSLRFYGQLEGGTANIAFTRLCAVARALEIEAADLVGDAGEAAARRRRAVVALLGLRGAGKSTLGPAIAKRLGAPFVELDERIEERAGMSAAEIFALHGEAFHRRLGTEALRELVQAGMPCVVAMPGGIVHDDAAFKLLRERCVTAWLRARPQDHMQRVLKQGDKRPMADRANAMGELRALLVAREPLYRQADLVVDTSRASVGAGTQSLVAGLTRLGWKAA